MNKVKSRVKHICAICNKVIPKGRKMKSESTKGPDGYRTKYYHIHCKS